MKKCEHKYEKESAFVDATENSIWIYDSNGDFLLDFDINYCPFCGLKCKKEVEI